MFKKYNSIENTYRSLFLEKIKNHGFWKDEYVVQEKAHGANLSYWTSDGINFRTAKRSGNIEASEKFYNHEPVLEGIKDQFSNIWNGLKEQYPDLSQMTIFGELIGGNYPHKDIAKDNHSSKIQKGIHYCPENRFYAFDILINAAQYLSVDEANHFFEKEGLLYAKTLFRGSIETCLEYPNEFDSTIPSLMQLPAIHPNICEGVVIRPVETLFMKNGNRVILKNKNEKWSENLKFDKKIIKTEPLSDKVIKLVEAIATYATENRLENVISKYGDFDMKDTGKLIGLFNKDILENFLKDYQHITDELEKKDYKTITKSIGRSTAGMVRERIRSAL